MNEDRLFNVSVVIPVYNAEDWIEETMQSVLDQTYPREALEVIVVDDGSTDDSAAVAESLLESTGLRYEIIQTEHRGPSHARNVGWRRARGPWIQFLDADDLLHPRKIELQTEAARSLPPEVAVVYSSWQRMALEGQEWRPTGAMLVPDIGPDPVADLLKAEGFLATGSQLFQRDWLERVSGFDERYWLIEDVHLMLRIAMAGGEFRFVETNTPLFFYRQRGAGSLSRRDRREFVEGCIRNAEMVEAYWRSRDELTPRRVDALTKVYFQGARYFAETDCKEFETLVAKIESFSPGFLPPAPKHLRWLSQVVGYRRAERLAVSYRRLKRVLT